MFVLEQQHFVYSISILRIVPLIIVRLLAKFTFPTIVSCSTLRTGPYLFYIEKFITQFPTT